MILGENSGSRDEGTNTSVAIYSANTTASTVKALMGRGKPYVELWSVCPSLSQGAKAASLCTQMREPKANNLFSSDGPPKGLTATQCLEDMAGTVYCAWQVHVSYCTLCWYSSVRV